ncbi:hypothetical protein [Desulforamulus aeronauticus]|uniref:Uncharacterized protein n=1 Tax=Desulforamulus aeronauticus DSM 10349 TaxID=1121421 RepID=A0A1M6S741_9FIRM|nr:hypothetical protein [Desulforamulus aeronauticus]SHK40327.1 hypothetical protein SAMN02745123_01756 [Desulforamulus aeronauticus DSM 10349]
MSAVGILGMLLAISGITLVVTFFALGGLYLLFSYGLYKLAQRANVENSWLAFIPIVQYYILGKVVKEVKIGSWVVPHLEWVLLLAPVIYGILTGIPFLTTIAGVLYLLFYIIVTYTLFKKYTPHAVVMTIVAFLLPFMYAIFVFAIRNNKAVIQL